jgi:TIR domain
MTEQNQFDVFLAHNSVDKPQVEKIANRLKEQGLRPWLDQEQIAAGELFQIEIQKVLFKIKSAAIFIGSTGMGDWQGIELPSLISQHISRKIPIIPVLLPNVNKIPDDLSFLQQFNWVSFESIDDDYALFKLECGINGYKTSEYLQNIQKKLADFMSQKDNLEQEIEKIEKKLSTIKSLTSRINPDVLRLLDWLAGGEEIAERYGSIALNHFPNLKRDVEEMNNLDIFYQDISCYLDFICKSMETDDKFYLNEPVFLPTLADSNIYKSASFEIYRDTFELIKRNIPPYIEIPIKNKLGEHLDYMLARLQAIS